MLRTEKRMRICITLLIMNLAFIWGNSLLPGEISGAVSDWVKDALQDLLPSSGSVSAGGFPLRKLAHFTEFTALGACLGWLFAMLRRKAAVPLLLGAAAACIDETIQIFVPDRGPAVRDVCIDFGGVLMGLALLHLGCAIWKNHQRNILEDK